MDSGYIRPNRKQGGTPSLPDGNFAEGTVREQTGNRQPHAHTCCGPAWKDSMPGRSFYRRIRTVFMFLPFCAAIVVKNTGGIVHFVL